MQIVRTIAAARDVAQVLPRPLVLVPTMGALHGGHLALIERARERGASVLASIFVNPLQFGPSEDFAKYPRAFAADAARLEAAGVDALFAPSVEEMYPVDFETSVDPGVIATRYDGALRPGHFRGVATVCTKLFAITGCDVAIFGAKDAQQVAVLRRIVRDLALALEIDVVPTQRDDDGLALSSRNAYLTPTERTAAPTLYRALRAMSQAAAEGFDRPRIIAAGRAQLLPPAREAYLDIVDAQTFGPIGAITPQAADASLAIGSIWLGQTRLIDNVPLAIDHVRARPPAGVA